MKIVCGILSILWLANVLATSINIDLPETKPELFKKYPASCKEANPKKNGIVKIQVNGKLLQVYCDVTVAGRAWLVIQRRVSPEENFFRNWTTYSDGFGNMQTNYFIGLNNLYDITVDQQQQLYVHLVDFDGQTRYARYDGFSIGNEAESYVLKTLGVYYGNAGDGLRNHENMKFSTFDRDNDNSTSLNCAAKYHGAWWYNDCLHSNLNGAYLSGSYADVRDLFGSGISWYEWRSLNYSYKTVQLMVQPK